MAAISNIINVSVSVSRAAPSREAYGIPLILPPLHTTFAERVRTYSDLTGLVSDGFATHSPSYKLASFLFSQSPRPPKIKIGRIDAGDAGDLGVALSAIQAADPKFWAIIAPATYNATSATEQASILQIAAWAETRRVCYFAETGAADMIAAGANIASMLKAGGYTRSTVWYHGVSPQTLTLTMDSALVAANQVDGKVNGNALAATVFAGDSDTTLGALATAIQGEAAVATAAVTTVAAGTDNDREIVITAATPWQDVSLTNFFCTLGASQPAFSPAVATPASASLAAAIAGRCLAKDPGSVNWANQANLAAITADDLSQTAITALENQRANYYAPFTDDLSFTRLGTTAATYFLDQLRGLDSMVTALEDALLYLFANTDKVSKDDDGKEIVRKELISVLQRYKRFNFLAGDVEQAVNMTGSTFSGRNLTGMVINAEGAGALNGVALQINFTE